YKNAGEEKQPCVMIYPGFLDLRLYDRLYDNQTVDFDIPATDKVIDLLKTGPKKIKELQESTMYKSRSRFLQEVINPLIDAGKIYREGSVKSPSSIFKLK
ncbi:MAG: AAA family ATPase, partial [Spirochaetia bacterium]|nr:AAA family ATPase [Spirochaetia bacterium]